jgi:hypothetical protein
MRQTLFASALVLAVATTSQAQLVGYGINSDGFLFRFNPDNPVTTTTIGNTGIPSRGIDFRPGTQTLYSLAVGPNTAQLYTIDLNTAAATPVGAGFPVSGAGYNLAGNNRIGFDFNPRTLQPDTSMRIRVITDNSASNLRLNSLTGAIAATDPALAFAVGDPNQNIAPFTNASAYINSAAGTLPSAGTTTLYNIDPRRDILLTQNPANAGTLNTVGPLLDVDLEPDVAFDIVSSNPADDSLADERAILVARGLLPARGAPTPYRLWDVNLTTGLATNPRLVGGSEDFFGGMALVIVPEPTTALALASATALMLRRTRRA